MRRVRIVAWTVLLLLAAMQGWVFRHTVQPDGIAYLDLSDAVVRGRWSELVNGYWSPVYPMAIGIVRLLVSATPLGAPYWEFALVHVVNLLAFALSLAAFEWFQRALDAAGANWGGGQQPLASPIGRAIAYVLFGTMSLVMISIKATTPDVLVSAIVFAMFASLIRLRDNPQDGATAIRLGGLLAAGALTKSFFFPLGVVVIVTLGIATWKRAGASAAARAAVLRSAAMFVTVTLPWCVALSVSLGRPSIGETGSLNYAWWVNHHEPPQSGVMPALAAPRDSLPLTGLAVMPASQARGTNPLWYDPVRWHRDVRPRFSVAQQWNRLSWSIGYYIGITAPLLFVALVIGAAASRRDVRATIARSLVVLLPSLAALGAYALVFAAARYVAPFLIATSLTLAAAFPRDAPLRASRMALAACVSLLAIDALSPMRGRVFLTYGLALFIPAWLAWRTRGPALRWTLSGGTAVVLLWAVSLLPSIVVRSLALAAGLFLWLSLSRSADSADAVASHGSLRRALAIAAVFVTLVPGFVDGYRAFARWARAPRTEVHPEWAAAQRAIRDGTPMGSRIAVIGSPYDVGWARLARYQIVAVVPEAQAPAFWQLSDADRGRILRAFSEAGATRLVTHASP